MRCGGSHERGPIHPQPRRDSSTWRLTPDLDRRDRDLGAVGLRAQAVAKMTPESEVPWPAVASHRAKRPAMPNALTNTHYASYDELWLGGTLIALTTDFTGLWPMMTFASTAACRPTRWTTSFRSALCPCWVRCLGQLESSFWSPRAESATRWLGQRYSKRSALSEGLFRQKSESATRPFWRRLAGLRPILTEWATFSPPRSGSPWFERHGLRRG